MKYTLEELRAIPIFFIVGKGRSGTTLLSTILDSHPNVASATESRFLLLIWQKYKNLKKWTPDMAEDFLDSVLKDFRVEYHWEFEDDFIEQLKQLPPETKVQDLIKMVYIFKKSYFQKGKIKFVIDKNPRYTLFVYHLSKIFPKGKFIRIIRDPRDNVTSSIKYNKRKCEYIAYKWLRYNKIFDSFEKKNPKISTTIRFEDLILDKELFFKNFENYTGIDSLLDVESKRLSIKTQFEEKLSDTFKEQHAATVKPMDKSKIGHYKKVLKPKQIKGVEKVCFPYAKKFGYETANELGKLSLQEKFRFNKHFLYNYFGNHIIYKLPYPLLLRARKYVLTHVMKNKLEKYRSPNGS